MKKIIFFMMIICACMSQVVCADSDVKAKIDEVVENSRYYKGGELGDNLKWERYTDRTLIITGKGDMQDMSVSDRPWYTSKLRVGGYPYYSGYSTESYASDIRKIIIGDGITSIGNNAFYGLEFLETVILPDGLQRIGMNAFSGCTALTDINLPDSLQYIEMGAFSKCKNLLEIDIPDGVEVIEEYAFSGCKKLTEIQLPSGLRQLEGAFGTAGLKKIEIPDGITKLNGSLKDCQQLTEVSIPDGVTEIVDAFNGCEKLEQIDIPDSVTVINGGFDGCYKLKEFVFPPRVEYVRLNFKDCRSLTEIVLPRCVEEIDDQAFLGCYSLKTIVIPKSVKEIGKQAFSGCVELEKIYFEGTKEDWITMKVSAGNELLELNDIELICDINMEDFLPEKQEEEPIEEESVVEEEIVADASVWAVEYIIEAMRSNLVPEENRNGYKVVISREECCELIYRLMKELDLLDKDAVSAVSFADTDNKAVTALSAAGIIYGKSKDSFAPDDLLTREEFAAILGRICAKADIDDAVDEELEYCDAEEISAWAVSEVKKMLKNDIMVGDEKNNFNPKNNIKKEEVIITVLKLYNITKGEKGREV